MKAVLVFLLVSLTVANVSSMPFQQGRMAEFFQFLRKLMAMYKQRMMARGSAGSHTGGSSGGHTGSSSAGQTGGSTGASTATCDLGDYVCVPRGTCESASDVQTGLTCANPNHDCCDM